MNRFKNMLILVVSITMLVGCKNTSTYEKAIAEGKISIVNKDYSTAEKMFELAIEENKRDKEANGLYNQLNKLIQTNELITQGELEKSLKVCEEILKIETESDVIKEEANKLKKEINTEIDNKKIIRGNFEKYLYYNISMLNNTQSVDFELSRKEDEEEHARLELGLDTQTGMKAMLIIGDLSYNLIDECVFTEDALDNNGDLKEGYSIDIAIEDLNNDEYSDIIIACGDRNQELSANIFLIHGGGGDIYIEKVGTITGQRYIEFKNNGNIEVPFGSQGYRDKYSINGLELKDEWEQIISKNKENYICVVCGKDNAMICSYDECNVFCDDDIGYYCDCGEEYHHREELCPLYDV